MAAACALANLAIACCARFTGYAGGPSPSAGPRAASMRSSAAWNAAASGKPCSAGTRSWKMGLSSGDAANASPSTFAPPQSMAKSCSSSASRDRVAPSCSSSRALTMPASAAKSSVCTAYSSMRESRCVSFSSCVHCLSMSCAFTTSSFAAAGAARSFAAFFLLPPFAPLLFGAAAAAAAAAPAAAETSAAADSSAVGLGASGFGSAVSSAGAPARGAGPGAAGCSCEARCLLRRPSSRASPSSKLCGRTKECGTSTSTRPSSTYLTSTLCRPARMTRATPPYFAPEAQSRGATLTISPTAKDGAVGGAVPPPPPREAAASGYGA